MCATEPPRQTRRRSEGGTVVRLRRIVYSLGWLAAIALAVSAGWKNG